MRQKVNPHGLKVGVIRNWGSEWYAEADPVDCLAEDYNMRKFLKKKLLSAGISKTKTEHASDRVKIIIYTAKPGVVIGKGGSEIEKPKGEAQKLTDKKLFIGTKEIRHLDRDVQLAAEFIMRQLEDRVFSHRATEPAMGGAMKAGVKGVKTAVVGRPDRADMARTEFYNGGIIPLQTLRADVDYGFVEADITYDEVGTKVWIYKGEVFPTKGNKEGSDK